MDLLLEDPQPTEPVPLWGDGAMIPAPPAVASDPAAAGAGLAAPVPAPAPGAGDGALDYAEPWTETPSPEQQAQRDAASAALAGRFTIVADAADKQAPNAITQEEYDRMVALYADIASGSGDLVLGEGLTNDAAFKAAALEDLACILQTPGGRIMLRRLNDNVTRDADGNFVHRTTRLGESGNPSSAGTLPLGDIEVGLGVDAETSYKPGRDLVTPNGAVRSDVVLFHELRHAYDVTGGTVALGEVEAGEGIPPEDVDELRAEHQVCGLGEFAGLGMTENQYRADRNAIALGDAGVRAGDAEMVQRESYKQFVW